MIYMNKKGFTLIELLSVVTLIVLVSVLVLPNISSSINKKKNEINDANNKLLYEAANVYISNHSNEYLNSNEASGSVYCIPIQELVNDGILGVPFKDVDGNEIDYSKFLKATYFSTFNNFDYDIVDECVESINYISKPNLVNNMIPVVYEDGVWKKADVTSKWYDYSSKKWANAVVVSEFKSNDVASKSRFEYKQALPGTEINQSDILAFFVWIPRFKYQLFESNSPVSVNIVFEGVATHSSNASTVGEWLTHPAFTFNNSELSGIWVGKYESSNSNNSIIIKNGQTPWTNISYDDVVNNSNSMVYINNIYGMDDGVNSHLIRNSEWSAVSLLSNSIYGINDRVNVSNSSLTGNSDSTTGNITGVYDMSGLSSEFVSVNGETENMFGYSLFETKNWYGDSNRFVDSSNIYLSRGGTSLFNYSSVNSFDSSISFRVVITN